MWPTASTDTLGSEWQAAETRWAARAAQRRPQIRRMRFRLSKAASMIRCRVYTLQAGLWGHTGAHQQEKEIRFRRAFNILEPPDPDPLHLAVSKMAYGIHSCMSSTEHLKGVPETSDHSFPLQ